MLIAPPRWLTEGEIQMWNLALASAPRELHLCDTSTLAAWCSAADRMKIQTDALSICGGEPEIVAIHLDIIYGIEREMKAAAKYLGFDPLRRTIN